MGPDMESQDQLGSEALTEGKLSLAGEASVVGCLSACQSIQCSVGLISLLSNEASQFSTLWGPTRVSSGLSWAHSSALVSLILLKSILRCLPILMGLMGCVCLEFYFF